MPSAAAVFEPRVEPLWATVEHIWEPGYRSQRRREPQRGHQNSAWNAVLNSQSVSNNIYPDGADWSSALPRRPGIPRVSRIQAAQAVSLWKVFRRLFSKEESLECPVDCAKLTFLVLVIGRRQPSAAAVGRRESTWMGNSKSWIAWSRQFAIFQLISCKSKAIEPHNFGR